MISASITIVLTDNSVAVARRITAQIVVPLESWAQAKKAAMSKIAAEMVEIAIKEHVSAREDWPILPTLVISDQSSNQPDPVIVNSAEEFTRAFGDDDENPTRNIPENSGQELPKITANSVPVSDIDYVVSGQWVDPIYASAKGKMETVRDRAVTIELSMDERIRWNQGPRAHPFGHDSWMDVIDGVTYIFRTRDDCDRFKALR